MALTGKANFEAPARLAWEMAQKMKTMASPGGMFCSMLRLSSGARLFVKPRWLCGVVGARAMPVQLDHLWSAFTVFGVLPHAAHVHLPQPPVAHSPSTVPLHIHTPGPTFRPWLVYCWERNTMLLHSTPTPTPHPARTLALVMYIHACAPPRPICIPVQERSRTHTTCTWQPCT
jgi:hypothetical protein